MPTGIPGRVHSPPPGVSAWSQDLEPPPHPASRTQPLALPGPTSKAWRPAPPKKTIRATESHEPRPPRSARPVPKTEVEPEPKPRPAFLPRLRVQPHPQMCRHGSSPCPVLRLGSAAPRLCTCLHRSKPRRHILQNAGGNCGQERGCAPEPPTTATPPPRAALGLGQISGDRSGFGTLGSGGRPGVREAVKGSRASAPSPRPQPQQGGATGRLGPWARRSEGSHADSEKSSLRWNGIAASPRAGDAKRPPLSR